MKRLTTEEILADVVRSLAIPKWNYSFEPNDWFFPSDVRPHSSTFKYRCKKLHALGLLERDGDSPSRWGFRYRAPLAEVIKDNDE